jgi:hypothetical protein
MRKSLGIIFMISLIVSMILLIVCPPCVWAENISFDMDLPAGWSMISLPLIPDNASVSSLFPEAVVAYGYEKDSGYVRVQDLEEGRGYWILLDSPQKYTPFGQPIYELTQTVNEDKWDMIGGCSVPAQASMDNGTIKVIYKYVQGSGYKRVTGSEDLEPGKGYWILMSDIVEHAIFHIVKIEKPESPELEFLTITPSYFNLTEKESVKNLCVIGTYSDGSTKDLTMGASGSIYSSSDPGIATVNNDGVVTGLSNGIVIISVTNGGTSATANAQIIVQPDEWVLCDGTNKASWYSMSYPVGMAGDSNCNEIIGEGNGISLKDLSTQGCPMAHCDGDMSDLVNTAPPIVDAAASDNADLIELWSDFESLDGSDWGIGCSGNGKIVACSFKNFSKEHNVIVYDPYEPDPNKLRKWTSKEELNEGAWTSAPIVTTLGEVIACDNKRICRFDPNGNIIWCRCFPKLCSPISPVILERGESRVIILATNGGPILVFNSKNGDLLDSAYIAEDDLVEESSSFFETINTPCVKGNRIYVSTHHSIYPNRARLVAIDLDPNDKLKHVWHYEFGGRSGASPLLIDDTIYFDGHSGIKEAIFSNSHDDFNPQISDNGQVVWCKDEGEHYDIVLHHIEYAGNFNVMPIQTINPHDDISPQINNKGQVVWCSFRYDSEDSGDYEIFLYDGSSPKQLSDNPGCDSLPQINNNGKVVWCGYEGENYEIFFYDCNKIKKISDNPYDDFSPQINNEGLMVWYGRKDGEDYEIFVHDGNQILIETTDPDDDLYPQINDNGKVVWCRYVNKNYEIFLYDIYEKKFPKNISNNTFDDLFPQINNKGQVVWHGYDGEDYEIFLYNPDPNTDPNERIIKTDNSHDDLFPQINNKGQVVWYGYDGKDYEIFLYDPDPNTDPNESTIKTEIKTDNPYDDISPQINEKGEIVWCGHDGVDYEILVYRLSFAPPTPRQLSQPDNEMPTIFAVKDLGASCMELWTRRVSSTIEASFAKDPRGGFWYFLFEKEDLIRLGTDGSFLQWIKLSKDILKKEPGEYWPYSVMTIAGEDPNNPIMIVSAKRCTSEEDPNCSKCTKGDTDGGAYVVAIDLVKEELKWKFKISDDQKDYTAGQFPIVFKEGKAPRVIFTNNNKGTYCIGTE